jgi:hypothetical protein
MPSLRPYCSLIRARTTMSIRCLQSDRAAPEGREGDVHQLTQPIGWEGSNMFFDEPEPHGFWLA